MGFKENLKNLRVENGYTQKGLAEALNLSKNSICEWEKGRCEPGLDSLVKLTEIFQVDLNYLIGNEEITSFRQEKRDLELSKEELDLIKFYRAIDKPSKLAIFTTAKSFYNQLPKEKRLSDSI